MPKGHVTIITPEQDEIIRKCWANNGYGHHAAKRAAQLTGLSPDVAHRRATQLGLVFTRERYRWTEPELDVVEENAHLALDTIQKRLRVASPPGVKRTRAAIAGQIFGQRFRANLDGLKHGPLAEALGISRERLHYFRTAKMIAGERMESIAAACGHREVVNDEARPWFYRDDQIVRFLFAARGELNLGKVNQTWLMGLLEPYITIKILQPSATRMLEAEREGTKLARRRTRKMKRSTTTGPLRPGILGESAVNAIRSGKSSLQRNRNGRGSERPSNGAAGFPQSGTATGTTLKPAGGGSASSKNGNGTVTSLSGSPSTGPAGDPNAG